MIVAAKSGYDIGRDLATGGPVKETIYVLVGLAVLLGFIFAARFAAHLVGGQLGKRNVRGDLVVLGRRVATALVIVIGIFVALGFAVQNASLPLFGLLLATIVAALGVQDLLKDYVSGYYILLEHHVRVGDRITFDSHTGTITEVRLRVTLLRSEEGDVVIVPNSELFTKPITIHGVTPEAEAKKAPPA
jgi:small conductance mechanosensitive channel